MEFSLRDLASFGAIAVSLIGGFVTARIQIKQLMEKMAEHNSIFTRTDQRLDEAESARGVIESRVAILSEINSVSALEKRTMQITDLTTTVRMLQSEFSLLRSLHNGSHPVTTKEDK